MDENLVIGSELLNYMTALKNMAAELVKDSMTSFVKSHSSHIECLQMFYQKAASYAYSTYESIHQSDTAMAAWILGQMEKGQVAAECVQVN